MNDSTLLKYVYSIITDKKTANRYMFTNIRDKNTMEVAGIGEATEMIERLYNRAISEEAALNKKG